MSTLMLRLAARGWMPGTARWATALWAGWALALVAVAIALILSVRQWLEAQRTPATALPASVAAIARTTTLAEEVLDRLRLADPKATALQTLHHALEGAPGVQLVSVEFGAPPTAAGRLDRTDVTFQLRGPYAPVKQVLAQWSARFEASSLLSLRLQRSATTPGTVEATVSAALWTRPAVTTASDAASSVR
jgi:hypothetical protein